MTRSSRTAGVLIRLASVVAVPLLGTGCFFAAFRAEASRTDAASHPLAAGGRLEVTGMNGGIEVSSGPAGQVVVEQRITCRAPTDEEAREGLDLALPEVTSEPARLSIRSLPAATSRRDYEVNFRITAPQDASLFLKTSNGAIRVEGIRGSIEGSTSNGELAVRNAGSGIVRLSSSNGKVVAERVEGSLWAHTSNGAVRVVGCPGPIEIGTSNGGVDVDASGGLAGDLRAGTSNGHVRCVLPDAFQGQIEARTSSARVRCGFPVEPRGSRRKESSLAGAVGGPGPLVRLITSNGPIDIVPGSGAPLTVPAPVPAVPAAPAATPPGDDARRV